MLGVKPGSSSESILKSYKAKLKEAKNAKDETLVAKIENAHSSIMMQQLTLRLKVICAQLMATRDFWLPAMRLGHTLLCFRTKMGLVCDLIHIDKSSMILCLPSNLSKWTIALSIRLVVDLICYHNVHFLIQGQVSVSSDIAYADKEDLVPWRPR